MTRRNPFLTPTEDGAEVRMQALLTRMQETADAYEREANTASQQAKDMRERAGQANMTTGTAVRIAKLEAKVSQCKDFATTVRLLMAQARGVLR
jgi:hypothetical protein